ncbi:hypothetical protein J6590_065839 [Homalodisca vitripennis]|nr:hypothetical protein J6590_065839 [Homalodisca vitripennis]
MTLSKTTCNLQRYRTHGADCKGRVTNDGVARRSADDSQLALCNVQCPLYSPHSRSSLERLHFSYCPILQLKCSYSDRPIPRPTLYVSVCLSILKGTGLKTLTKHGSGAQRTSAARDPVTLQRQARMSVRPHVRLSQFTDYCYSTDQSDVSSSSKFNLDVVSREKRSVVLLRSSILYIKLWVQYSWFRTNCSCVYMSEQSQLIKQSAYFLNSKLHNWYKVSIV